MSTTTDPFTQVYEALWGLLEAHPGFVGLVKVGNRIKYSGDSERQVDKPQALSADLPQVRLVPAGGAVEVGPSSTSGCRIVEQLDVEVWSGDRRLQVALYPVKWEVLKALAGARDNLGLAFVTKLRMGDAREALRAGPDWGDPRTALKADPAWLGHRGRHGGGGVTGWVLVLRVSVEMWFSAAEIAA
jgi:hypothetical protein